MARTKGSYSGSTPKVPVPLKLNQEKQDQLKAIKLNNDLPSTNAAIEFCIQNQHERENQSSDSM